MNNQAGWFIGLFTTVNPSHCIAPLCAQIHEHELSTAKISGGLELVAELSTHCISDVVIESNSKKSQTSIRGPTTIRKEVEVYSCSKWPMAKGVDWSCSMMPPYIYIYIPWHFPEHSSEISGWICYTFSSKISRKGCRDGPAIGTLHHDCSFINRSSSADKQDDFHFRAR